MMAMFYTERMGLFSALIPSALIALSLISCSGTTVDPNDPAALYENAQKLVENDHYQLATEKFRAVRSRFPYSKYAALAQLRIADVYFLQDLFTEAAVAYEAFLDLHPKHEKAPYAMFRIGKSYFMDTPDVVGRDLTPAKQAIDAYSEFLGKYPNAPEAKEAREDLFQAKTKLAQKEIYIGDFYEKREKYRAAKNRYQKVIELYPDTPAVSEAKEKIKSVERQMSE